ncbi:MAG: nucleotidyltransferase domain-containing protein [Euryarchaeota archaeon]|nr:nucleotidyltransferase domain-containing protein [Euryarchaeota archaeon]
MPRIASLTSIVRSLRQFNPERILLVGSRARGDADRWSDTDIVVVARTRLPFVERLRRAALLCPAPGVDILVYTPEELEQMRRQGNPFVRAFLREGRVLYEKR